MSIKRTVCCDVCSHEYTEEHPNDGFPDWGQLTGIVLDGSENPYLCPVCLKHTADFVDTMKKENT